MERYYKIISSCCYVKKDGKVLMLYRNKKDSHSDARVYRGVGGKAEQGESPIDCVKREVKEEAGIDIDPIWKGVVTFSNQKSNDWEAHVFIAEGYTGNIIECDEGELSWIDESELKNLEMPEADKKLLPYIFDESKFQAHAVYGTDKKLVKLKVDKF